MNKNDLRFIKTEKLICDTFRSLCISNQKIPAVTTLCSAALINKSTFYTHYDSIEVLQQKTAKETVHALMSETPDLSCLFSDTKAFVLSLISIFDKKTSTVRFLFNSAGEMINIIEQEILSLYINPETQGNLSLKIRFCVGGSLRLLSCSLEEKTVSETIELIKKVLA